MTTPAASPPAPAKIDLGAWMNEALERQRSGDLAAAEAGFRRVLGVAPELADALNFLGLVRMQQGALDEAIALMERSLALAPLNAGFWGNRAALYQQQRLESGVEACLRRAAELDPASPSHAANLGHFLHSHKRFDEAQAAYERALALEPGLGDVWGALAHVHLEADRPTEALAAFARAETHAPDSVPLLLALAHAHKKLERFDEALAAAQRALALAPASADVQQALGNIYGHFWRHEEAVGHLRAAIALAPEKADIYQNLGVVYGDLHDLEQVEAAVGQAIALRPSEGPWRMQLGMAYLQHGLLAEGWEGLDYRDRRTPPFAFPEWRGEPLEGKRFLLVGEQGAGDHIQFVRFATTLAARGATVDVLTSEALVALFQTVPGIRRATHVYDGERYDHWCIGMSAPRWLETSLNDLGGHVPYLTPAPERVAAWRARIDAVAPAGRRVGLVWAGNPQHVRDAIRSMKLADLAPLADVPGVSWFSLQKGYAEAQLEAPPAGMTIHALGPELTDFAETAAAMQALDLVIAVDTSSSHLAGALGRPVWVMLCVAPDWRWLLARADSPWYPSARLFRQRTHQRWDDVLAEVRSALLAEG